MEDKKDIDEISLIDLFVVLWRYKIMIIVITLVGAIGAVVFSVISLKLPPNKSPLPNLYTSRASMLINDASSQGGGLSSMLNSSGLGNLAGLAGVTRGATFSQLAIYLANSNSLLDAIADEFDLMSRYTTRRNRSPRTSIRNSLKRSLVASADDKSGVFTIRFTHIDPEFAQRVVNFSVLYLQEWFSELRIDKNRIEERNLETNISNTFEEIKKLEFEAQRLGQSVARGGIGVPSFAFDMNKLEIELETYRRIYTQLRVQHELVKVALASETPVFQILEMAEVPDQKSRPARARLCVIVTFSAGFFAIFLAFVLNAISNISKDQEAMAKLRGSNRAY